MSRIFYRSLLRLHPNAFRRRFSAEMLCIFDEVAVDGGTMVLLTDALISLTRQWLLRTGSWIAIAAVIGGFVQVAVGGLSFLFYTRSGLSARRPVSALTQLPAAYAESIQLMLWTSGSVVLIVLLTTLWVRNFTRRIESR